MIPEEIMDRRDENQYLKDWKFFRTDKNLNFQTEITTVPNKINKKKSTQRHIIVKLQNIKDKEMIFKKQPEKRKVVYIEMRLMCDFSKITSEAKSNLKVTKNQITSNPYKTFYFKNENKIL